MHIPPCGHCWPTEPKPHFPSNSPSSHLYPKLHGPSQAPVFQRNPWCCGQVFCWPDLTPCHHLNPDQFPTDSSKVAFAISFMTEYAAAWSQPYLMSVFNAEEVVFGKFLDDFRCSFFDHNCQHRAEVALQSLCQSGKVSAYTQEFNSHAHTENIQLAMVMSNIEFIYLRIMQAMALKADQTIQAIRSGRL
ncbi:uncharacterized protein VP01_1715g2 [Puccinia sorghi]|uniref:Retrotransposon gag domain-containing protein n=1 Tax=Puccinia sorghi TaxID=27349 RepID=A0A0L6VFJ3_9BASI|nr:uncharacterized protein VP01_1715g2 [Puccinia sorghi]